MYIKGRWMALGVIFAVAGAAVIAGTASGDGGSPPSPPLFDAAEAMSKPRFPVADESGEIIGTVPTEVILPGRVPRPNEVPLVTPVLDDDGEVVAYLLRNAGLVDKETFEAPGFDPVRYVAEFGTRIAQQR